MADKIKVMIVDDLRETRNSVSKMLQFDLDIEVVAEAENGVDAVSKATKLIPDVILMDVNMPDMDGITATKKISQSVPQCQIIIMSVQSDTPYMRKAMSAGARDFLMKPFSLDELHRSVHEVYDRRPVHLGSLPSPGLVGGNGAMPNSNKGKAATTNDGQIVTVYSPKGGSGCSTIALNAAVTLANAGKSTLLIDGSFQFGTLAVMLNMKQTTTILDISERVNDLETDLVKSIALTHDSGLQVLLSPPKPEMADHVTEEHLNTMLPFLRSVYDFVVIDAPSAIDTKTLALLDHADKILLITDQELPSLKTARDFLNLMRALDYSNEKVMLTMNKVIRKARISVKDVTNILKRPVVFSIPLDLESAKQAADQGTPLVMGKTKKKAIAVALHDIGIQLVSSEEGEVAIATEPKKGFFARLFSRS
jgi:pilus assembly protein CpaE